MLSTLRHKGFSRKILWAVTVIIVLSFGVFGVANRLDHTLNSAGKIYGKTVSLRDYEKAYLDSRDQAILSYGDRFFKMGQMLDLEREAWTRIILLHEARKRHMTTTDKEVVESIAAVPFFQSQGQFNQAVYDNVVRNTSVFDRKPKDFENGIRDSLTIRKLLETAAGPSVITDDDLKKEYITKNEKIKLDYVLFAPADFNAGLSVSDAEALKFYNEHKENFRQPPSVNVQYVHMLYPEKADEKQKQAVKNKAIALAHGLNPKADFAAVASKHGVTAKESGPFTQDQPLLTFAWSPEFVDKIFAMKVGELSNPVESPDGWQIIKVKEKKPDSTPEFNTITAKVKETVLADKAFGLAKAKADAMLKTMQERIKTKDLKAIAQELGLKVQETTEFSRGEYINAPGLIAEFQQESMNINEGNKLSSVVITSQGPVILYLSSTETIDDKKFDLDKEDFRQMMGAQRRNQAIAAFITKLKLEADLKTDLKDKIRYR